MDQVRQLIARRQRSLRDEDGVALLSTLLFMILLAGLSLVLLSVLLGQIGPSYAAQKSTRTVYAAQAGLQAGLGLIRSSAAAPVSGRVYGDRTRLPCSVNGRLDGSDSEVTYEVEIRYFDEDPTGKDEAWQAGSQRITCTSLGADRQPSFALLISEGLASAVPGSAASVGNRYLEATYKFKLSNENIPGGRIFDASGANCLEVQGSHTAFVPNAQCIASDNASQLWIYDTDYTIKLASSTIAGATALCITDTGTGSSDAKLEACLTGEARWTQLWSWVGGENWQGQQNPIAAGPSARCLRPPSGVGNDKLTVSTGCSGSLSPEAAVGSGAAGKATNQIVNFKEFGRCADVTNEQINYSFMITYPCKQDPTGTGTYLKWNHKWVYSEPMAGQTVRAGQEISVIDSGGNRRCLQAPASSGGVDVVFKPCTGAASDLQKWTRSSDTGSSLTSYTFVDNAGRCLAAEPVTFGSPDTNLTNVASKIRMQTCNGLTTQKWNAPAAYTDAGFGSFRETSG